MLLMDFSAKTDCEDVDCTPGVNTALFFEGWIESSTFTASIVT